MSTEDGELLGSNCAVTNEPNPRADIKKIDAKLVPALVHRGATIRVNTTIVLRGIALESTPLLALAPRSCTQYQIKH